MFVKDLIYATLGGTGPGGDALGGGMARRRRRGRLPDLSEAELRLAQQRGIAIDGGDARRRTILTDPRVGKRRR